MFPFYTSTSETSEKLCFFLFFQGVGYKNVTFAWIGFTITLKILLEEKVAPIYLFLHLHHSPTRFRGLHIILRCNHSQTTRPNVFLLAHTLQCLDKSYEGLIYYNVASSFLCIGTKTEKVQICETKLSQKIFQSLGSYLWLYHLFHSV